MNKSARSGLGSRRSGFSGFLKADDAADDLGAMVPGAVAGDGLSSRELLGTSSSNNKKDEPDKEIKKEKDDSKCHILNCQS